MFKENFVESIKLALQNIEKAREKMSVNVVEKEIISDNIKKISGKTGICTDPNCAFRGSPQPEKNFNKNKSRENGLSQKCKVCNVNYNATRKEKIREYDKNRSEEVKKRKREDSLKYNNEHREERKLYGRNRYENKKEERKEATKIWKHQLAKYDTFVEKLNIYEEIRRDPENNELLQVKCNLCKEWFNPQNKNIHNRLECIVNNNKKGEARLYCSDKCKELCPVFHRVDEPKPEDWTPNFRPERNKRPLQGQLRDMVLERDEYTCQKCGATDVALVCHHITGVQQNPLESADVDNCVTVCKKCDSFIHSQAGCTPSDLRCKK